MASSGNPLKHVLVTGGAGYIGCILCPKLLEKGYRVTVLDFLYFGKNNLEALESYPDFKIICADIRDTGFIKKLFDKEKYDCVIHLAAVSNDPCSDLDAELTKSINLDATHSLMHLAKESGVKRFIYASSASVYGIKETSDVHEELPLEPLTLYAKYKAEGEEILNSLIDENFEGVSVRAATVCGYSPRLRLDLTINILTNSAVNEGKITVFGGDQMRPNIHIQDLTDLYLLLLEAEGISGKTYNASHSNAKVLELAKMVQDGLGQSIPIDIIPTEDNRSYHLSGNKLQKELGFTPQYSPEDAVSELAEKFREGAIREPEHMRYRNVAYMQNNLSFWQTTQPHRQ